MRYAKWMMLIPVAAVVAACGRSSTPAVDDALKNDLSLASQAQAPNMTVSPTEAGYAPQPQPAAARQRAYTAPVRHTSSARRSRGVYSSGSSSGGGYYPAPAPVVVEKHTQRDAAIGAVSGAVLGATMSRDKVKGGLIGAAVGGILGGVIGNNVDVQRRP
jgi:hypothetical protein